MNNTIYIIKNIYKDKENIVVKSIAKKLGDHNVKIVNKESDVKEDAKIVIIIGGDGTMLQGIKRLCSIGCPVIGINKGTLGFMTEIEDSNLDKSLLDIINNDYEVEERILIEGKANNIKDGCQTLVYNGVAVNDIVFNKAGDSNIITLDVYINNKYMDTYVCDGLIIATPTGSTAYNLSAGGPVLLPETNANVITPICPHSLNNRSIVVSDKDEIRVVVGQSKEYAIDKVAVNVDGTTALLLETGDSFVIKKSEKKARIARLKDSNIVSRIMSKLNRCRA